MIERTFEVWRLLVVALVLLLSSCAYVPSSPPAAGPPADLTDPATWPDDIRGPATDAIWAAQVAAKLDGLRVTTGRLHFNSSGYGYELASGWDETYREAKDFYVRQGVIHPTSPQVVEHVEAKAAWLTGQKEKTFSVLVINNRNGVCSHASKIGCTGFLPKLLAPGTAMVVWHPLPQGGIARKEFAHP